MIKVTPQLRYSEGRHSHGAYCAECVTIPTNCKLEFPLYTLTEMLNRFVIGFRNLRVWKSTRHGEPMLSFYLISQEEEAKRHTHSAIFYKYTNESMQDIGGRTVLHLAAFLR